MIRLESYEELLYRNKEKKADSSDLRSLAFKFCSVCLNNPSEGYWESLWNK